MMNDIFGNIIAELFGDNPFATKTENKEEKRKESPKPIGRLAALRKKETKDKEEKSKSETESRKATLSKKPLASYNRKKINRGLRKDKDLTINRVISKRFVPTDDEGRYPNADLKNFMDEYKGDTEIEIPSTAIADVKYDPRSRVCYVRYTSGNKWYRFVNMSPEQFKSFMNASSKGRYVQRIMRKRNHDPAYPRTI